MKTIYKTNPKRILGYLMAFAMVFFTTNVTGQCTNSSSYGSGIAPTSGTNTISTCNYLSEFSTISGVVAGATYTNNIQLSGVTVGYVTIVEGNGITHHGPAPLTWTADTSGSVTGHWNVDSSCATAFGCHTTTIMYGAPALGCMSATACNYDSTANMDDGSCTYPGCTDPLAVNYSASAGCDDGSCMYSCTAAPYSEDFEAGMGTWTTANTGTGSYPGWYRDSGGTPSSATGPSSGANASTWYMHIETSGTGGPYTLTSECLDISALTVPSLNFQYHMYGASMGSLDVTVNGTNVFTMSGDQGDQWHQAQIDLSAFIGSDIVVEFTGARGTSYTGDMAIDQVDVIEYAVIVTPGCMDSLAYNYNANANVDDSSCLYGCPAGATAVTLPYSGSGLTNCGNGNSVNSAAAGAGYLGSYYLNGEDASYEWTASSNEVVQVDLTTTTTYSAIWVFDGCPGTSGVVVVAAKSSSSNETLQFTQVSGSTYYVVVDTWPSPNCIPSYDLSIAELLVVPGCTDPLAANYNASATLDDGSCAYPPANDDCANAEAIACGASAVGNNTAASANAPGGGAAIWYSVVGQGGDITVSTCGTGFDTRLYVLDACGGTQVAYNDDANCIPGTYSSTSTTTFTSVSGTVYSIAVSGYSSSTTPGAVNISVSCAAAPVPGCTDSTATNYNVLATVDDSSCTYAPVSSMCCNSFAYGSATANPIGAVTISTCNYLSEYSTISGVDANTSYTAAVTGGLLDSLNPGWITVYEGSSCGTLVAEGTSPLTFTSTVAGTYYIHWSVDNTCATAFP